MHALQMYTKTWFVKLKLKFFCIKKFNPSWLSTFFFSCNKISRGIIRIWDKYSWIYIIYSKIGNDFNYYILLNLKKNNINLNKIKTFLVSGIRSFFFTECTLIVSLTLDKHLIQGNLFEFGISFSSFNITLLINYYEGI